MKRVPPSRSFSLLAFLLIVGWVGASRADQPFSPAERQLFLSNHLDNVGEARTLRYDFQRNGTLESQFSDKVRVTLGKKANGQGRQTNVEFLSGERNLKLPEVDVAKGNPVILSFLERDVREMQRLTKGQANYFRKRVRVALADSAKVENVEIEYAGKTIPAQRISVAPYQDDPLKARFARYADKIYTFTLSERVPGWVYEMRTLIKNRNAEQLNPLIEEVLSFGGVEE